jgi:hypothetical protein
MVGRPGSGLSDAWVQAKVTDQLLGAVEAPNIANGRLERERHDQIDAGDRHQTCDALVSQGRAREIALNHLQVLAEPIKLTEMSLNGEALVLGQNLIGKPNPALGPAQIGVRAGRDEVRVQDRLDDVLQPRALAHDLITAGDLPAQSLSWLVSNPDLRQEAAGVKLGEHAGVDRVGLDLGMGDNPHLLGVGDHDPLHVRADHGGHRRCVAGRLDHDHVVLGQGCGKGIEPIALHVDPPQSSELAVLPGHRLGKRAVDVQSDDAHAHSLQASLVLNGSWRATRHLLIRAHGASGPVARGGHVTSSGSQPNVYRRPARTFVLPVPRVPDGLTIRLLSNENSWKTALE